MKNLKHYIEPSKISTEELKKIITETDAIKFISLSGIDLGNHATDERIPKNFILDDFEDFLKNGIQTDGSSVYLPIIAEINNAKVDIVPDSTVKWFIDYNHNHLDENGCPIGTLDIPSFLRHTDKYVGSRSVLKRTAEYVKKEIIELLKDANSLINLPINSVDEIDEVILTSATELEFWVKTPDQRSNIEKLSASQELKEHYWKRTVGQVRTAMENSLIGLNNAGFNAEMAHKEVGGVPAKLTGTNIYSGIMEQLEIDWKYDFSLQSADNELYAKNIIKDTFEEQGLVVNFKAKPIEGVAGSGEHTHVSISLKLNNGKVVNLFSHKDHKNNYMNKFGWGALYGITHNYDIVNPFVTATTDGFKRLKPGFEAPVCTVTSIGYSPQNPSRNRTVLLGLIRDLNNPMATRFELRSPNPNSNTYLTISAMYLTMLDGIKYAINSNKTCDELYENFIKKENESKFYLDDSRLYTTEKDVFDDFNEEERNKLFTTPPNTVYENLLNLNKTDKLKILTKGNAFNETLIESYKVSMLTQWENEIRYRLKERLLTLARRYKKMHNIDDVTDLDVDNWENLNSMRHELVKDSLSKKSLITQIINALNEKDFEKASNLQIEIDKKTNILNQRYITYKNNLINI
ncbi:glutamine synthetase [Clostridiaceae bacterium HSG29]|nr:glutamine synthetase [Clostridiaceae bacterium HSG29]